MYILADLEWIENKDKRRYYTQIAMVRVDENWQPLERFYRRICPGNPDFYQWNHKALSGGTKEDFLNAPDMVRVLSHLLQWLQPSDEICWWKADSLEQFQYLLPALPNPQRILSGRTASYLQESSNASPYDLGKYFFIDRPQPKHDARNDVEMIRRLLEYIHFPQPLPPYISKAQLNDPIITAHLAYTAHIETNKIHKKGCPQIPENGHLKGYFKLTQAVGKGYMPCHCVNKEFRETLRKWNQSVIDRSTYNYLYTPKSEIFHRRQCKIMLSAREVKGYVHYRSCLKDGRHPCRVCNPGPEDDPSFTTKKAQLAADEQRAINRHKQAQEERNAIKQKANLTKSQTDALYTLSQPRYAFFAAKGYENFHLRNCKKVSGLTELQGFSHYNNAIDAGYRPCKYCKPSNKHDVHISLPIFSRKRDNDSHKILRSLCVQHNVRFKREGFLIYMETAVGIWRVDTGTSPYRLEHINLIQEPENRTDFHRQPRLFLSLKDVFRYIKRHDDSMSNQQTGGTL